MDADEFRRATERLIQIDESLRVLNKEREQVKKRLDEVTKTMFKPTQVGPVSLGGGLRAVRSLHSTRIKVNSIVEALEWASSIGADVLVEAPIAKKKLDQLGVKYSDNRILYEGDQVPGLYTEQLYNISYEREQQ